MKKIIEEYGFTDKPFKSITERFNLSEFECFCIQSAFSAELDSTLSPTIDSALKEYSVMLKLKPNDERIREAMKSFVGNRPLSYLCGFQSGGHFRLREEIFRFILGDIPLITPESARLNSNAVQLIQPAFTQDDLILDNQTESLLRQISQTLTIRPKLYNEYGFGKLFPYGRGIGILFHGASGTGKTMAVQALAAELGLLVMKADISRIVDKYIGETEKHITEVFDIAKESNCILFFDEADSIFAKRTEVLDSRDRSANSQTAHLLQKMEEYDGAVVLATNLIENIDDAFKRRLPFVVEFKRPDSMLRRLIWERFIPTEVPRAEDVDIEFLAETFPLTPAVIKWAAFSAAVRAFAGGENGKGVLRQEHILDSLRYEYEKTGAVFPEINDDEVKLCI